MDAILISGRIRSGKTTSVRLLRDHYRAAGLRVATFQNPKGWFDLSLDPDHYQIPIAAFAGDRGIPDPAWLPAGYDLGIVEVSFNSRLTHPDYAGPRLPKLWHNRPDLITEAVDHTGVIPAHILGRVGDLYTKCDPALAEVIDDPAVDNQLHLWKPGDLFRVDLPAHNDLSPLYDLRAVTIGFVPGEWSAVFSDIRPGAWGDDGDLYLVGRGPSVRDTIVPDKPAICLCPPAVTGWVWPFNDRYPNRRFDDAGMPYSWPRLFAGLEMEIRDRVLYLSGPAPVLDLLRDDRFLGMLEDLIYGRV